MKSPTGSWEISKLERLSYKTEENGSHWSSIKRYKGEGTRLPEENYLCRIDTMVHKAF
jgi:hypothetical protein